MAGESDPFEILVMPGEGIGPETIEQAVLLLEQVIQITGLRARVQQFEVGWPAIEKLGRPLPQEAEDLLDSVWKSPRAAILYGATSDEPIGILRKRYDLYANLRPIRSSAVLAEVSPLKKQLVTDVDMMIVRELVSGIYYGDSRSGTNDDGDWATQEMWYGESEISRIAKTALQLAAQRRRKLTFVHKGNVIRDVFALWSEVITRDSQSFPDVEVEGMLVDNMAMQMMLRPATFDVVLTTNLLGDILSEIGAGIVGSLGLVPSASLNAHGFALYEPVGGTAPDIAGKQLANPVAAILCVAMMCRHTFKLPEVAERIHAAVDTVLQQFRTADIAHHSCTTTSTSELGEMIRDQM